jgi:hypothetical protein
VAVTVTALLVVALGALAVQPASAAEASSGAGTMTVSPTSATAGSANNQFVFTFTGPSGGFSANSQVRLTIPAGWTNPTGITTAAATQGGGGCASVGAPSISGAGPWTVDVAMTCAAGKQFTITYGGGTATTNVTAPTTAGAVTFLTQSKSSTGTLADLATSPSVTVAPAAASKLAFTTQPASGTAGAAFGQPAVSVQDQFGNTVTSNTSTVTVAIANNPSGGTLAGTKSVAAVSGVATFSGLSIDKSGTGYTLSATDGSLTSATSSAFNIAAGAANKLVFAQQPTSAVAGASIAPAVTVQIQDAGGNLTASTANVTVAIATNAGGGTLSGTLTVAASGGVATFSNLSVNKTGTGYTLSAAGTSLTGATSSAFNISPAAASNLAFTTQPSAGSGGAAFGQPAVTVQDQFGNTVTADTSTVTVAIANNPSGGTLSGTKSVAAVSGVATFSGLSIDKAGTGYTLSATDGSLAAATSNPFTITVGAANKLAFAQQPTTTVAGVSIAPAVTVQIQDAGGNLTASTANVTVAIATNAGGGTLSGTLTVAASGGVATFSNLSINKTGTGYTLSATGTSLTSGTSGAFNITPAAASKLVIAQQPTTTVAGVSIAPAVTLQVQDQFGNVATSNSSSVTVAIANNAGGGTLSGTLTVAANSGVATFSDLSINKAGTGYTLNATDGALTPATTSAFNINPAAPAQLVIVQGPSDTAAAAAMSPSVTVQEQDQFGNNTTTTMTVTLGASSGAINSGSSATTDATGLATFSAVKINTAAAGLTLTASSPGLASTPASASFTVFVNVSNSAAALTDTATDGANGSGVKSVSYYYCPGYSGGCTTATGTIIGTSTTPAGSFPVTWTSQPANGPYRLIAVGIDNLNNTGTPAASIPVKVLNVGTKLVITSSAVSGTASASATLGPITVQLQDATGSAVRATSDTAVGLTSNSTGTAVFAATSGGGAVTSVTIPTGSTSATFFYGDTKAGTPTVTAAFSGLASAAQQETINVGAATQVVLSGSTADLPSGSTRTFTATIEDAQGNTVPTGADATRVVTFSQPSGTGTVTGLGTSTASGGVATDTVTGGTRGPVTLRATATLTGGPATSNSLSFTIPPPTITSPTSASPESVPKNSSATFTIVGTGLQSGAAVSIPGGGFTVNTVTWVDASHLSVNVTATNSRGTYDLTVTNPDGGSTTSTNSMVNS